MSPKTSSLLQVKLVTSKLKKSYPLENGGCDLKKKIQGCLLVASGRLRGTRKNLLSHLAG